MESATTLIYNALQPYLLPIMFYFTAFFIILVIRYLYEEFTNPYFEDNAFGKTHFIGDGMACTFALVYTCILYLFSGINSNVAAFVILFIFVSFLVIIIKTQNQDYAGYIENFDDMSGAVMYLTATMYPIILSLLYALLTVATYPIYKKTESSELESFSHNRFVDFLETLLAVIVIKIIKPDSFLENLWLNVFLLILFTLIVPLINEIKFYKTVE